MLLVGAVWLLTGCSPGIVTGVGLTEDRRVTLLNCGTWITAVDIADARTNRIVWSAVKGPGTNEFGVDRVRAGELPAQDWIEQLPLAAEPRPSRWRVSLSFRSGAGESTTIEVDDTQLRPGEWFVPGRTALVRDEAFDADVCGDAAPLADRGLLLAAALVIGAPALAVGAAVLFVRRWRKLASPR